MQFKIAALLTRNDIVTAHSTRVFTCVYEVLNLMPEGLLTRQDERTLLMAALLHDIGKAYWKPELFLKPKNLLTAVEWEAMQRHPKIAANVLKNLNFPYPEVIELVEHHHDREYGIDNLSIKILASCDIYVACTENRSYRSQPLSEKEILKEIGNFAPDFIRQILTRTPLRQTVNKTEGENDECSMA